MTTRIKTRSVRPDCKPKQVERVPLTARTEKIRRARRRIASGFYDSEACLDAVIDRLMNEVPCASKPGRKAASRGPRKRKPPTRTPGR